MKPAKIRYQLFLTRPLSERLEALAAKPGVSRSSILEQALAAWFERRGYSELEDRFGLRLNRMNAALDQLERDSFILLETLALFVRYELAIHAPLAENDSAGRAAAARRFEAFVGQVGRQIAGGQRSIGASREAGL